MANAILAAILSLIIPGLGQLYGGQGIVKAIIFFVIAVILGSLSSGLFIISWILWVLYVLFVLYTAYDAYMNVE